MSDEVRLLIMDCKNALENYRMYGDAVDDGLKQLDKLYELVSVGKITEAYKLTVELSRMIAPYRPYIADVADRADAIKAKLEEMKS
jgi:hypothetical protein